MAERWRALHRSMLATEELGDGTLEAAVDAGIRLARRDDGGVRAQTHLFAVCQPCLNGRARDTVTLLAEIERLARFMHKVADELEMERRIAGGHPGRLPATLRHEANRVLTEIRSDEGDPA